MATPASLADHELLTTTSNGCLETEDVYGDALADIPNIVVFVNLDARTPLLHCISWYDLRATLEQPTIAPAERVRLWRSDERLPSNYVYRVLDRWFDPMLEPLTRYYNTFLLDGSYEARIGTQLAVSALHGATERLYRVRPVHRADVVAYVRGALTAGELRATLAATVTDSSGTSASVGRASADASSRTVTFTPMPEDTVRPSVLYRDDCMAITRPVEGRPFGHTMLWRRGQPDATVTSDGSLTIEELGDSPAPPAPPAPTNDVDQRDLYEYTVQIPGIERTWSLILDETGEEQLDDEEPEHGDTFFPIAGEVTVTIDGIPYRMRPRVTDDRWDDDLPWVELNSEPSLPDDGDDEAPAITAFRFFLAHAVNYDVRSHIESGQAVLQFINGPTVYEHGGRYHYVDGTLPAFDPPLAVGLFDFTLLGREAEPARRYRVLLDEEDRPQTYIYDHVRHRFRPLPAAPPVVVALLQENAAVQGRTNRQYRVIDGSRYLVIDGRYYSLETGAEEYPLDSAA